MKKLFKNKKGFTLVELLVVLAILAILIAIAVPVMTGALNDARDKAAFADARTAYIAYEMKRAESDDVTIADIKAYLDRSSDTSIQCWVDVTEDAEGNITKVNAFYYTDSNIKDKCVKIDLENKASIQKSLPTVEGNVKKID